MLALHRTQLRMVLAAAFLSHFEAFSLLCDTDLMLSSHSTGVRWSAYIVLSFWVAGECSGMC